MIDCISVKNMRLSDAYAIANLVPSLELMYRAAYGVFKAADWHGQTAIVVGSGNNGGDGFALACILKGNNSDCTIFTVSQRLSADSAYYAEKAASAGISIRPLNRDALKVLTSWWTACWELVFRGRFGRITAPPSKPSTLPMPMLSA